MFANFTTKLVAGLIDKGFSIDSERMDEYLIDNNTPILNLNKMQPKIYCVVFLINATSGRDPIGYNLDSFMDFAQKSGFKHVYLINCYITDGENTSVNSIIENSEAFDNNTLYSINWNINIKKEEVLCSPVQPSDMFGINKIIKNSFQDNINFSKDKLFKIKEILASSKNYLITRPNNKPVMLTYFLILVNVVIFLAMTFDGGSTDTDVLLKYGAMYTPYVIYEKEYFRILTAMFLHIGISHLIFNMFSLYIFGRVVEKYMGVVKFLVIYFVAGIAGSLIGLLETNIVSAGASGAIYGLVGAIAALAFVSKRSIEFFSFYNIAIFIVLSVFTDMGGQVNIGAHLIGFVTGFIVSFIFAKFHKAEAN